MSVKQAPRGVERLCCNLCRPYGTRAHSPLHPAWSAGLSLSPKFGLVLACLVPSPQTDMRSRHSLYSPLRITVIRERTTARLNRLLKKPEPQISH